MDVKVSGNYACLADAHFGLEVIDVSNPLSAQRVGGYDTGGLVWSLATRSNLVYLADLNAGMVIVDLADRTQPRRIGGYAVSTLGIALDGARAYLACGSNGVHVLDINDPADPKRLGWCAVPGEAHGIAASGGYAYVVDFRAGLLVIISLLNPSAPQVLGSYHAGLNPTDIALAGGIVYVAAGTAGLLIWDVRDPSRPILVGSWQGDCVVRNVAVSGNLAFLTTGVCSGDTVMKAIRVIDVADPSNPIRVGGLDSMGWRGLARSGEHLYVADANQGLRVIASAELPAVTSASAANGHFSLSWNQAATGFTLQRTASLDAPDWQDVPDSEGANRMALPFLNPVQFYRLRLQASGALENRPGTN